jgi:hypothetical protein
VSPATTAVDDGQQVASVAGLLYDAVGKPSAKAELQAVAVSYPATMAAKDGHTTAGLLADVVPPTIDASGVEVDAAARILTEAVADHRAKKSAEAVSKSG